MNAVLRICGLPLAVALCSGPLFGPAQSSSEPRSDAGPVRVILDTDIGPDCDDVGAVCVLHALADRGEAHILGMMCCTSCEWGAPCLDALNAYFGRTDIPVGTLKERGFLADAGYNRVLAETYPHRIKNGKDAPDAVGLYRQLLAGQPDGSVVIVAVGPLKTLSKLLDSPADKTSSLNGAELVAKKVKLLSCMGGWYPKATGERGPEFNFQKDVAAAKVVTERWPTPVVFSGAEIGSGIMTGRRVATDEPEYHPLTLAFAVWPDAGFGRDRASWDETAVLYGVRGPGKYWSLSKNGYNRIGEKGTNTFTEDRDRTHRYLVPSTPVSELEDVIEGLMVGAREGPSDFDFNIATYSQDGIGTVAAKDEVPPDGAKSHAFDRNPKSVWMAKSPTSWIGYQCPDGKKYAVSKYRITSAFAAAEHDPGSWTLSGSNDGGKTWAQLDSRGPEGFDGRGRTREFAFKNDAAFNIYRFDFSASRAVHVAGIELLEHVQNERGVPVTGISLDQTKVSIPVAGRAALNVSVTPLNARDKDVVWASSDGQVASVQRIGKNTAMVSARRAGACTVTATGTNGKSLASCSVAVTDSTLPAPWVYREINSPAVPGGASYSAETFTLTGGGAAIERWWKRVYDQFSFVCQNKRGDWEIVARVTAQTKSSPGAIAGLMFRESTARDSRFVLLGITPARELFLSWRSGPEDEGPRKVLGKYDLPIYLKLRRRGASFDASVSADGTNWGEPLGTFSSKAFEPDMMVGLCVTARNNPTTSTATFDHVSVTERPPAK
ncbi:Ig-like domain-containing protein [Frigoriglobus tundricola]|uniref:BIG2 domain-containing protein n=1 Tax=Frigoriglobus tundricola TaxID=2774151 RepID=A0A6M5Z144_9BACT|nr:Ig-like domain-containing protein [Frigoriglobus tundricola]QJW98932.1 hypothetical protein FTUN_6527 [Frigoriglobus tundricola]